MNKTTKFLTIAIAATLACATLAKADEAMTEGKMGMMDEALMQRMKEYQTPGAAHELLNKLVGTWKAEVKFWMDPAGEPEVSEGVSINNSIFGGRFVEQVYTGTAMGQPFEGRGLYGFDNITKEYIAIWLDNMGTGIMESTGSFDESSNTLQETGKMSCPITNNKRAYRSVTKFVDDSTFTYETFMDDGAGNEVKTMMITYKRAQ